MATTVTSSSVCAGGGHLNLLLDDAELGVTAGTEATALGGVAGDASADAIGNLEGKALHAWRVTIAIVRRADEALAREEERQVESIARCNRKIMSPCDQPGQGGLGCITFHTSQTGSRYLHVPPSTG